MTSGIADEYVARHASDLDDAVQGALRNLIETLIETGDPRSARVQFALDVFLDAAGQGVLKAEPARRYIQHFIENPHAIAARYFYKDSSKVLEPDVRAALISLVVDRIFREDWATGERR